ncbi:hypothetical protein DRF65_08470 [Chryseobacterium pennae]|uniref:HEAT repeat domain-containing protein n=1 Tax=Chryseobacterium pennae TaxID=2258962 RepID=A0A3D9CB74_9FLAO|nr:hypothetical protein [Chryseobacterium pennae]REC62846.1 hypothetical protein DRF65_08470 [Chryseobacterium pennae]
MDIKTTLEKYRIIGHYFDPDYERDNEALNEFKADNPNLSEQQTSELIHLLQNNSELTDKYFVADLLYLYSNFSIELLDPLLRTAIHHKDPSFNRIFLNPCLVAFGLKTVADNLADKFNHTNTIERIGISNLVYWLRPQKNDEADRLHQSIINRANHTSNLVELYHYKLRYTDRIKNINHIPNNATELIKAISGNKEYEDLLFNQLGWGK